MLLNNYFNFEHSISTKKYKIFPPKTKNSNKLFLFYLHKILFCFEIFFSQKNISENNIISFQLAMVVVGTINGTTTFPSKF
jgi:hypothetical protein